MKKLMQYAAVAALAACMPSLGAQAARFGYDPDERSRNPSFKRIRARRAAELDPYFGIASKGRRGARKRMLAMEAARLKHGGKRRVSPLYRGGGIAIAGL